MNYREELFKALTELTEHLEIRALTHWLKYARRQEKRGKAKWTH